MAANLTIPQNFIPQQGASLPVQVPGQATSVQPGLPVQQATGTVGQGFDNPLLAQYQQFYPQQQQQVQQPIQPQQVLDDPYAPKPFTMGDTGIGTTTPQGVAGQQPQSQQPMPIPPGMQMPGVPQMPPQQTMQWNQMNLQPQQPQPGLPGFPAIQPQQDNAIVQALTEQNKQTQELLRQVLSSQGTKAPASNEPDYLNMDSSQLLNLINADPESGESSKIRDILKSVQKQAVSEATSTVQKQLEEQQNLLNAVVKQHTETQAKAALSSLRSKYEGKDPMFQQNLMDVARLIETPEGKAYFKMFPDNAFEMAYLTMHAQKVATPEYQQMLAQQAQALQQHQVTQKLQGGGPAHAGITQNVVPFPMMQNQPNLPNGQSDMAVVAQILSAGQDGFGVPNIRVVA